MKKIKKVEKIDKALMDRLFDGSMTVKEANELIERIEDRCNYIVRTFIDIWGKWNEEIDWWDFSNECGKDGPSGYFNEVKYKFKVGFTGEFEFDGDRTFPTKWIWEDFEEEQIKEAADWKIKIQKDKEEAKAKRIADEANRKALIKSALKKLTTEECKALGYRKPKE